MKVIFLASKDLKKCTARRKPKNRRPVATVSVTSCKLKGKVVCVCVCILRRIYYPKILRKELKKTVNIVVNNAKINVFIFFFFLN